ncbi:MAG: hypothetical protein AAF674_16855 [Pseudomonadota bacterium]
MKDTNSEAGEGHNSAVECTRADFLSWVKTLSDIEHKLDALKAEKKKARKQARAAGVVLGDMDAALKLCDMNQADAQAHVTNLATYAEWLEAPIGHQFKIEFPNVIDEDDDDARMAELVSKARRDGFHAALRDGKSSAENPHPGGSDACAAWHEGHKKGLEVKAAETSVEPMGDDDTDDDD